MSRDDKVIAIVAAVSVAILVFSASFESSDCEDRGGVLVIGVVKPYFCYGATK